MELPCGEVFFYVRKLPHFCKTSTSQRFTAHDPLFTVDWSRRCRLDTQKVSHALGNRYMWTHQRGLCEDFFKKRISTARQTHNQHKWTPFTLRKPINLQCTVPLGREWVEWHVERRVKNHKTHYNLIVKKYSNVRHKSIQQFASNHPVW